MFFFFSSRRRHTRWPRDWSSDVCSSDLAVIVSPDVQINGLSSTELQDIYQGRITNWAQVGGPDEPITVVLHSNDSVTTEIGRASCRERVEIWVVAGVL